MSLLFSRFSRNVLNTARIARSLSSTARRHDHFLNVDKDAFTNVIETRSRSGDRVVLVDFHAEWCPPCKMISPILEKLTADEKVISGTGMPLDLVTIDTDEVPELAQKYGVTALPTVIAFRDGEPVEKFVGAIPEPRVRQFIDSV